MNQKYHLRIIILLMLLITLSSCEAIVGIFNAGLGLGIFLVTAVIVTLILVRARIKK